MAFYRDVLGDDPAELIIGADGHPVYPPTVGHNMALALRGSDKQRLTIIFDEQADGAR